jgi:hypothetical protein
VGVVKIDQVFQEKMNLPPSENDQGCFQETMNTYHQVKMIRAVIKT